MTPRRQPTLAFTLLFAVMIPFPYAVQGQEVLKADTIVMNGNIVTMDNKEMLSSDPGSIVEAMAIRKGADYIRALRDGREVWHAGRRIEMRPQAWPGLLPPLAARRPDGAASAPPAHVADCAGGAADRPAPPGDDRGRRCPSPPAGCGARTRDRAWRARACPPTTIARPPMPRLR